MLMKSPIRPVLSELRPNGIVAVAHLGLDRPGLIPLWFGETDLVTPAFIREAAIKALEDGKTFYTWARGIPELREAIAGYHRRTLGRAIDPERLLRGVPHRIDRVGEVKPDARQALDFAQPGVALDERPSVREGNAARGGLDARHRAAGYSRDAGSTGYTPAS